MTMFETYLRCAAIALLGVAASACVTLTDEHDPLPDHALLEEPDPGAWCDAGPSLSPEAPYEEGDQETYEEAYEDLATEPDPDREGNLRRAKRDYCCVYTDQAGYATCRDIRNYRDELGRLAAQYDCHNNKYGGTTSGSYKLRSASCSNVPECPVVISPPPEPTCANGAKEGTSWSQLRPGTRCEMVSYACKNLQIVETGSWPVTPCIEL